MDLESEDKEEQNPSGIVKKSSRFMDDGWVRKSASGGREGENRPGPPGMAPSVIRVLFVQEHSSTVHVGR